MSVNSDGVCYATREDVLKALDASSTWRSATQIDRLLESESRNAEGLLNRVFVPILDTRYFDWPPPVSSRSYRLWLDENELISDESMAVVTVANGATTLGAGTFFCEPANSGPPFNNIQMNLAGQGSFDIGTTQQRDVGVTGLFGYTNRTQKVGTTVGTFAIDDDLVTIADGVLAGVGSVLACESERMLLTDRYYVNTTDTITAGIDANKSTTLVPYSALVPIYAGEVLTIDAEQMIVQAVTGSNLTVRRGWAGTVLASHSNGAAIYSARQFKVTRGQLGTTAVAHGAGTTWSSWVVPGAVRQLVIGEVLNSFEQERTGFARTVGSGEYVRNAMGAGIADLRNTALRTVGRQMRTMAV